MPKVPKVVDRTVAMAFLLMMGAVSLRPSSRLMAASDGSGDSPEEKTAPARLKPVAGSPDIPFNNYDVQAERVLLDRANQSRAQAGVPALKLDAGLCKAARAHAELMVAARELSHRLDGEASLAERLAAATRTQLDLEGENVALDFNAEDGHQHLMLSPPHRANLLNAAYNVIGVGVLRSGDRLYIVQDFGHALPSYSTPEFKDRIAATLMQARRLAKQPDFIRRDLLTADEAACSMAQADKLSTSPIHQLAQRYTVLTYTTLRAETLPASAAQIFSNHNLRSFSLGACYGRTESYPTGVYWVVLSLE
jgi:uncharacterized protein YkwD